VCVAVAGCAGDDVVVPIAQNRVTGAHVEPEIAMGPLSAAADVEPAPETALALAPGVTIDARLLVITADGKSPSFAAITSALGYLGTPYDVFNATAGQDLTADLLAAGDHGRYYGIVLDTGDLAVGSASAFSDAEWLTLASYEARFGVRRAVLYAIPSASYGLQPKGEVDVKASPLSTACTAAGRLVFVGANCDAPVVIADGYAYASQAADAATTPLLADAAGSVYAATRSYADGREVLVLTFSQSPSALHTLELGYGVVHWVTNGLFVGERHAYLSAQIDDFFLKSAIYKSSATYRITAADLQAFADWQKARRSVSLTAQLRAAFAFNAFGAKPAGQDGLTDKALELGPTFEWINHTWDHASMNSMSYATAYEEFSKNHQYGAGSGLSRYRVENLVTPGITGLDNAEVMRAAWDVGIRQLVSDTSIAAQANPSPNAGYYNAHVPGLLSIPRRPAELYFNVSQPAEWITEFTDRSHGGPYTYDQVIDNGSETLLRYLMRGENDPWMFHQANLRDNGAGKSLLSDLLDAVLNKYAARATFPIVSPTMEELAAIVKARMSLDASGVVATIEPGHKLTVRVTNAATVPVTGLCTPSAETYAGRQISYLSLAAGQSMTVSLTDCNGGTGGGTGSGMGGAGGGDSGAGGSGTMGQLSTHGPHSRPRDGDGFGCVVSGSGARRGVGAGALLVVLVLAAARRRRGAHRRGHASWAMRPSLSGRSMR
jgi:hypothetical protein